MPRPYLPIETITNPVITNIGSSVMGDAERTRVEAESLRLAKALNHLLWAKTEVPTDTLAVPDAEDCLAYIDNDLQTAIDKLRSAIREINVALGCVEEELV